MQLGQAQAEQLQRQQAENQEEAQAQYQIAAIEEAVKTHLTREALSRYGTLKVAHPETAMRLVIAIAQLIEAGRITGMLSEEQIVSILKQIAKATSKKTNIIRK